MEAGCGSTCPVPGGFYSYSPNVGGNVVLLAIYALLLPAALYIGIRSNTPIFSATLATGSFLSIVGFLGRILLHQSPDSPIYFLLSLLGTVLGPSIISASIFVIFPHILSVYGERLSPFKPMLAELGLYTLIAIAIGVEMVGIVFISYGFNGVTRTKSASILVAGLSVQAAALLTSAAVYFSFVLTLSSGHGVPDDRHSNVYTAPQFGRFLRGIEISTTLLLAHSIYRIVELAGGVDSGLFQNEAAFMVMDGALPLVSGMLLTAFHPGAAFGAAWKQTSPRQWKRPNPLPFHEEQPRVSYTTHHAYDPNIRKQFSPKSAASQQTVTGSHLADIHRGSPGLPSNPRPGQKPPSPMIPSPMSTVVANKRFSERSERRVKAQQDMVDTEALW